MKFKLALILFALNSSQFDISDNLAPSIKGRELALILILLLTVILVNKNNPVFYNLSINFIEKLKLITSF